MHSVSKSSRKKPRSWSAQRDFNAQSSLRMVGAILSIGLSLSLLFSTVFIFRWIHHSVDPPAHVLAHDPVSHNHTNSILYRYHRKARFTSRDIWRGREEEDSSGLFSQVVTHVSSSGTGLMNKYFYRFHNVELRDKKLWVYYDPSEMQPPKEEHWVDIVSCNATSPRLPTMFVIKGNAQPVRWHYLPIVYTPVSEGEPVCKQRVEETTYLLQVRYSYNIWHTWNEGLMGLFQTLRELGKLPLVAVGARGEMTEILDGMGGIECPWIFDYKMNVPKRGDHCSKRTQIVTHKRCHVLSSTWCRGGSVSSFLRDTSEAPLIMTLTDESTQNVWSHLYDSITKKKKTFDQMDGACFKDLVIGKTSTLNFYQMLNSTPPDPAVLAKIPRINNVEARVEAMAVFKAFVNSAEQEWVSTSLNQAVSSWLGYEDEGLERLRQGIGPEDLEQGVLDPITIKSVPGSVREELKDLHTEIRKRERALDPIVKEFVQLYGEGKSEFPREVEELFDEEARASRLRMSSFDLHEIESSVFQNQKRRRLLLQKLNERNRNVWFEKEKEFKLENPRPVVTYMSRNFLSRGVLNEKDILHYILNKYNVTVRVTTFQEPLLQVMELLSHSDVLFGMHGAGWTNAMFMKRGAVALQMFPYGWRLPDNSTVRGFNYREIIYASEGRYMEWVNPSPENAYFRRIDFKKGDNVEFKLHPDPREPHPRDSWPGNQWIYQNTYIDMSHFGPHIDAMMLRAGIKPL